MDQNVRFTLLYKPILGHFAVPQPNVMLLLYTILVASAKFA